MARGRPPIFLIPSNSESQRINLWSVQLRSWGLLFSPESPLVGWRLYTRCSSRGYLGPNLTHPSFQGAERQAKMTRGYYLLLFTQHPEQWLRDFIQGKRKSTRRENSKALLQRI